MARILKRINFEANNKVPVKATQFAPASPPNAAAILDEKDFNSSSLTQEAEVSASISEAQSHVEMMLNQAQLQVVIWEEEARQAGWEAGYAEAQQVVDSQLSEILADVHSIADSAVEAKSRFLRESQAEMGRLAVAIAKKIIGKELTVNPRAVTDIVAQTIEAANVQGACYIRVNPQDYEILGPLWDAIPSLQPPGHTWELVADKHISRGSCLIETNGGIIDARLETQLAQVSAAIETISTGNATD
jgi:flagellar assembly protein FliH